MARGSTDSPIPYEVKIRGNFNSETRSVWPYYNTSTFSIAGVDASKVDERLSAGYVSSATLQRTLCASAVDDFDAYGVYWVHERKCNRSTIGNLERYQSVESIFSLGQVGVYDGRTCCDEHSHKNVEYSYDDNWHQYLLYLLDRVRHNKTPLTAHSEPISEASSRCIGGTA